MNSIYNIGVLTRMFQDFIEICGKSKVFSAYSYFLLQNHDFTQNASKEHA